MSIEILIIFLGSKKMSKITLIVLLLFSLSAQSMNITIRQLEHSYLKLDNVYNGFGCTGKNQLPHIDWNNLPREANYVGITIYDPDAPTGGGWWHWLITDIPVSKFSMISEENYKKVKLSGAIETPTSYGAAGYGGPCPPAGDVPHRYIIKVYALKQKLKLPTNTPPAQVGYNLNAKSIVSSSVTLLYGR